MGFYTSKEDIHHCERKGAIFFNFLMNDAEVSSFSEFYDKCDFREKLPIINHCKKKITDVKKILDSETKI